jgi:hypothetical protein
MLVLGFAFSGAGAGLAVSGISGSDSAGVAQYGTTQTTPTETNSLPQQQLAPGGGEGQPTEEPGGQGSAPEEVSEPAEQVSVDDGDSLPFTGLAAIPLILMGGVLLTSGFVLRRGTRDDDDS